MLPTRLHPRGTTLIEAMAAMVVFVIGILGVMQMNVLASAQNNLALHQTTASKIARDLADAFETIPSTNTDVFPLTSMEVDNPLFSDMSNSDGLKTLKEAVSTENVRQLLGAADAIRVAEGMDPDTEEEFYTVAWRTAQVENTGNQDISVGQRDSLRILIMVRFPTNGGFRQLNFWSIKPVYQFVNSGS